MTADQKPFGSEEQSILAAELALGLHGREAYEAARRDDPELRLAVEAWEDDLVGLANDLPPRPPDPRLWDALRAQIEPRPSLPRRLFDSLALWRLFAGGAVAACLALLLLPRTVAPVPGARPDAPPSIVQATSAPPLVASLLPREGSALYLGVYNPQTRQLVVVSAQAEPLPGSGTHRLWMVPDDVGEPVDLGPLRIAGETIIAIDAALASGMTAGSGLVVTLEPGDTPPAREERGDVLAHGKLRVF
ncbi:MAG: anti-sigma factor [Beijerinckiaceae bacterium]|nr:anti-sigma factor [Brevundimonas sp.]MCZ8302017.1 anti-sigma factor [Beijerinckiaceae bacterium]